jgi:hypothetical protein
MQGREYSLGRRQFCADFFSDSDDEEEVRDYDSSDGSSAPSDHRDGLDRDSVPRGWFREAVLELKTNSGKRFCIQCTTWKDKKQVMFLHTNTIGRSKEDYVHRHVRGQRERQKIRVPQSQKQHRTYFNAVDCNDRDSADWSTTIRTTRYYIRILCWGLDRVIHTCYVIICECAKGDIGPPEWKKYLSKQNGRHDFQIHLAIALLNFAISLDWIGIGERPEWMRQKGFVPCN